MVIVFARAPVSGKAKTRLASRIGAFRAAKLQARMTRQALITAKRAGCGPVELHGAPRAHAFFRLCARQYGVALRSQRGRDLGERMHRALAAALRRYRAAVLIGSDCPELGADDLRRAARSLRGACDVVLAPAEDGGYALIGARAARRGVFHGVAWGEASVYRRTVENLNARALRWRALRTVWDVDRPEDVARLDGLRFRRGAGAF
ncbi:MAG TPA: TIGR04282 family arsenosugar biosynthesis glycosyltransferase [Burkholderiales bacterium]